jgi:hypothetical protein
MIGRGIIFCGLRVEIRVEFFSSLFERAESKCGSKPDGNFSFCGACEEA